MPESRATLTAFNGADDVTIILLGGIEIAGIWITADDKAIHLAAQDNLSELIIIPWSSVLMLRGPMSFDESEA